MVVIHDVLKMFALPQLLVSMIVKINLWAFSIQFLPGNLLIIFRALRPCQLTVEKLKLSSDVNMYIKRITNNIKNI